MTLVLHWSTLRTNSKWLESRWIALQNSGHYSQISLRFWREQNE